MSFKKVVAKFGGTSMKDEQAMLRSAQIALEHHASLVVVSATSGTTDKLVELGRQASKGNWDECLDIIKHIDRRHHLIADKNDSPESTHELIDQLLGELETLAKGVSLLKDLTPKAYDNMLSVGERLSSLIITDTFKRIAPDLNVSFIDARELLKTDDNYNRAAPLIHETKMQCSEKLKLNQKNLYVTQGFIGSTVDGHTTTLGRGGSDYSAALLAEGCEADLLQIWTDVAGIATTDPRICPDARAINEISYLEASELAQYGAKILHPTTLVPAMRCNMQVFVGSTYDKDAPGTWIRPETELRPTMRAITKRADQSLLIVRTPEMLNAYGFLEKIFEVFRKHRISVDCVTTSEISVAVSVDSATVANQALLKDLRALGEVNTESELALISIIGNKIHRTVGIGYKVFSALQGINVRMICLGASEHNFCILVSNNQANEAISKLHQYFIDGGQL